MESHQLLLKHIHINIQKHELFVCLFVCCSEKITVIQNQTHD